LKRLIEKIQRNHVLYQISKDEKGQAIVGYVLIAAIVAVGAIAGLDPLRAAVVARFNALATAIGATY
jgi:Flp pilus assembly pilin Flp